MLLSAVGLFALTAHAVAWMTPEIGLRTVLGIAAGVGFALFWNRMFSGGQSPSNVGPIDFAIAAGLLTLVSLAACHVPAVRALRVVPIGAEI